VKSATCATDAYRTTAKGRGAGGWWGAGDVRAVWRNKTGSGNLGDHRLALPIGPIRLGRLWSGGVSREVIMAELQYGRRTWTIWYVPNRSEERFFATCEGENIEGGRGPLSL